MANSIYIGIDPGKTGGIAVIDKGEISQMKTMPMIGKEPDEAGFVDWLKRDVLLHSSARVVAIMEKVGAMRAQGVVSMFNFGRTYGAVRGVLAALDIPFTLVPPREWQRVMHTGISDRDPKKRSLIAARRLFPSQSFLATERSRVPHDGLVDAALIGEYGRRRGF